MEDERIRFSTWKDFGYHILSEQDALRKDCDEMKKKIEDVQTEHNTLEKKFDKLNTILWTGAKIIGILFFIVGIILGIFQINLN